VAEVSRCLALKQQRRYDHSLFLTVFNIHAAMLPKSDQRQKPTVGFQARFFSKVPRRANSRPARTCKGTIHEKVKTGEKKCRFFARTPYFSAKEDYFRVVFDCQNIVLFARHYPSMASKD
jgi:hypothetical protein